MVSVIKSLFPNNKKRSGGKSFNFCSSFPPTTVTTVPFKPPPFFQTLYPKTPPTSNKIKRITRITFVLVFIFFFFFPVVSSFFPFLAFFLSLPSTWLFSPLFFFFSSISSRLTSSISKSIFF